jgi:hypothetical protein
MFLKMQPFTAAHLMTMLEDAWEMRLQVRGFRLEVLAKCDVSKTAQNPRTGVKLAIKN